MDYIKKMREHVGHDMIETVGCGVLVENDKGQVLLQKRSDNGQWCVPGGGLEPIETFEEAAKRELREEVGIEVSDLELFGIYSGQDRLITYPNQDVVYSLSVIFVTKTYTGQISDEDWEVLEHRFFTKEEILDPDFEKNLFIADKRPILDWARGEKRVVVK